MHTHSVVAPNDILAVELSDCDVSLKPGERKKIDVTIKPSAAFKKNVTLDGNNSKTLLTGDVVQGHITRCEPPPMPRRSRIKSCR